MMLADEGVLITDRFGVFGTFIMWITGFTAFGFPLVTDYHLYVQLFGSVDGAIVGLVMGFVLFMLAFWSLRIFARRRYQKMSYDEIHRKFIGESKKKGRINSPSQFLQWPETLNAALAGNTFAIYFNYKNQRAGGIAIFRKEYRPSDLMPASQSEMYENFKKLVNEKLPGKFEIKAE